jgi:hypothetical protein
MSDKTIAIDEQFLDVKRQFDGVNIQFERIATAIVKGFDRIDKTLETKANADDMQRVLGLLDEPAKRQEISDDERLVMGHQLERLDR